MSVPDEAVEAVANHRMDRIELIHDENTGEYRLAPSTASELLEVAAPIIRADERQKIVKEIRNGLPEALHKNADSAYGWLSDGWENTTTNAISDYVSYLGEGSIDLHGITEIAVEIVEEGGE